MTTTTQPPDNEPQSVELDGIRVEARPDWEVRIRRVEESLDGSETTRPVVHVATVPLAADRADYGGGVVETLGPDDVFISLVEFGPEAANTELFAPVDEFPSAVDPELFHPKQLQRLIEGQAGQQVFFSYQDRPFCLYVVVGSAAKTVELADRATQMVQSITVFDFETP